MLELETFAARAVAASRGELAPAEVLAPLQAGLERLFSDFDAALAAQPAEWIDELGVEIDEIEETVEECRELVEVCLAPEAQAQDWQDLLDVHSRLNRSLAEFHRRCWVLRGPTEVFWINILVDAGEGFLAGRPLPQRVSWLLEEQVQRLELRLAGRPGDPAQEILRTVRRLADWARETSLLARSELEAVLRQLIDDGHRLAPWLAEAPVSVGQLLQALETQPGSSQCWALLDGVLQALRRMRTDFSLALAATEVIGREELQRVLASLQGFEAQLSLVAESPEEALDEAALAELWQQHRALEKEIAAYHQAVQLDGDAANSETLLRELDAAYDGQPLEEEEVTRLRSSCLGYQQGLVPEELLRAEFDRLRQRFEGALQGLPGEDEAGWETEVGQRFQAGVERIAQALELLEHCLDSGGLDLEQGYLTYLQGVELLRSAKQRIVSESPTTKGSPS